MLVGIAVTGLGLGAMMTWSQLVASHPQFLVVAGTTRWHGRFDTRGLIR